jgi:hypothetical protein
LKAVDGVALLLEGLLLARTSDAENQQLALELRELDVPLLQRLLRRLASGTLPLKLRPGINKSGPLLLELPFSPLAGGTLLLKLVLRRGERSNLGVEGGLQLVGLLGLLLSRTRPLLSLALLGLHLSEPRADLLVVDPDGGHLRLPVGCQRVHPL